MSRRVAIIAVHGVGDPGAGKTGETLANLLMNLNDRNTGTSFCAFDERTIEIPVRPLAGVQEEDPKEKRLFRFDDRGRHIRELHEHALPPAPDDLIPVDVDFTLDMVNELTDEGPEVAYRTCRRSTVLTGDQQEKIEVDLYELYWADLVRVGTGAVRAMGAMYQIMLHLPAIGQRELDMARVFEKSWWWTVYDHLQDYSVRLLRQAMPALNLIMLALVLISAPLKLLDSFPSETNLVQGVPAVIFTILTVALVGCGLARFWGRGVWLLPPLCLALAFGGWWLTGKCGAHKMICFEWILISNAAVFLLMLVYQRRCLGVWLITLLCALPMALAVTCKIGFTNGTTQSILQEVFTVASWLWVVMAFTWWILIGMAVIACVWGLIVGLISRVTRKTEVQAWSVAWTLRVTLALATSSFYIVTLMLWAVIAFVGRTTLLPKDANFYVSPGIMRLFKPFYVTDHLTAVGPDPRTFPLGEFVRAVINASGGQSFLFVALFLVAAFILAAIGLSMPIWGDIRVPPNPAGSAERYCRWLNGGNIFLRGAGEMVFFGSLFIVPVFELAEGYSSYFDWLRDHTIILDSVGTIMGGLLLALFLGGKLDSISSRVGPVLTAALDVDAYLRLHPRQDTPRGRIYTRYVALLREVCKTQPQYHEVIIVSHSQGTVITADLFRFLRACPDRALEVIGFDQKHLGASAQTGIPMRLITAGSPLRQLYQEHFPNLYRWIGGGPDPKTLGLNSWLNVFRTGDYIGRWLWLGNNDERTFKPDVQTNWNSSSGSTGNYHPSQSKSEINIGGGAHVHYFDIHAPTMAYAIDAILKTPATENNTTALSGTE